MQVQGESVSPKIARERLSSSVRIKRRKAFFTGGPRGAAKRPAKVTLTKCTAAHFGKKESLESFSALMRVFSRPLSFSRCARRNRWRYSPLRVFFSQAGALDARFYFRRRVTQSLSLYEPAAASERDTPLNPVCFQP